MKTYTNVRDAIFGELYELAKKDHNIVLLSGDASAFIFKQFKEDFPDQFFNLGVSEQNAISVAAGLALSGKRVFVYGIANFVTLRCYEQIKIDICCMELPVTILGTGLGYSYNIDGPTHYMTENVSIMRALPKMKIWSPSDYSMAADIINMAYKEKGPNCILFDKGPFPQLYKQKGEDFSKGVALLNPGKDVAIISTGIMLANCQALVGKLKEKGIDAALIDLYQLKPVNKELLLEFLKPCKRAVTVEEHTICGGLGSIVNDTLAEGGIMMPVKVIGIQDICRREAGERETLRSLDGLDVTSLTKAVSEWCGKQ